MPSTAILLLSLSILFKAFVSETTDDKNSTSEENPIHSRIAGGRSVHAGDIPYQLQLRYDNKFTCGAALIVSQFGNQVVLTSGRCITDDDDNELPANMLTVVGGRVKINGVHNYEQTRQVTKVVRHPEWKRTYSYYYFDLAVLHINKPFEINRLVQPIELVDREITKPTGYLTISGWGFTDPKEGSYATYLQIAALEIISNEECVKIYQGEITAPINNYVFCAGVEANPTYQGACIGDTGGPAVNAYNNTLYLVGIFNWGMPKCGNRYQPTIYTDLSYFPYWIQNAASPKN